MADKRIADLTEGTTVDPDNDVFVYVDSDTNTTKKIAAGNMVPTRIATRNVDSVSDLQNGSFSGFNRIWLSGYYGVGTAGGGPLYRDSADTTTADNGGTVFVDADGVRWKRVEQPHLTPQMFGARATADSASAFHAARDLAKTENKELLLHGDILVKSTVTLDGGSVVRAANARILKEHAGLGLEFTGGPNYDYLFGHLDIRGYGANEGDGTAASSSEPGIKFSQSRVRVKGRLRSTFHKGDGIIFDAVSGNANKSDFEELWSNSNNGHGFVFQGTDDNASVWRIGFYSRGNYNDGYNFATDFSGRQWEGFIYSESNANDGVSKGINIGKLRNSQLFTYAEETNTSADEITIGAACDNLLIFTGRNNRITNNSPRRCGLRWGNAVVANGATTFDGFTRAIGLNNDSSKYVDYEWETSDGVIVRRRVQGDGELKWYVYDPINGEGVLDRVDSVGIRNIQSFNGSATSMFRLVGGRGTVDSPSAAQVGDVVGSYRFGVQTGSSSYDAAEFRAETTNVGSGNKASVDLILALTVGGGTSRTDFLRISKDGEVELLEPGNGIIMASPDGTRWRAIIDDTGSWSISAV